MKISDEITNTQDVIDSRDVIARIEYLTGADELSDDEKQELSALQKLAEQCEGYGDWEHGETLIRDSYFKEYAQELAEDIGAIDSNATWPNNCIDWDQATRELQMDYTCVDFDGIEYWMRS